MAEFINSMLMTINTCEPSDECQEKKVSSNPEDKIHYCFIRSSFQLPIEYLEESQKHSLSSIVSSDLELTDSLDTEEKSIYEHTFVPKTSFARNVMPMFKNTFTKNTAFLQDTQTIVENMSRICQPTETYQVPCDLLNENWRKIKHDPKFIETYGYLEWDILKEYNTNSVVLQSLTIANMLSPVMSFILPFLFMLFPFVILKIQGIPITLGVYFQVLKEIARHHFIGQALTVFESFSYQKLIYLLVMLGLYGFQMYQNTVQCLRFYSNVQCINNELCTWKEFQKHSSKRIERYIDVTDQMESYTPFRKELAKHLEILNSIEDMLYPIVPFTCSVTKTTEIGYMLKCYYMLHTNDDFEKTLSFCMGFEGYLECMNGLHTQHKNGILNKASYVTEEDVSVVLDVDEMDISGEIHTNVTFPECKIIQQYYPSHQYEPVCIKNDVALDTYGVITGPNASGKTTYLKTTAINVILSQQIGMGFYDSCKMMPYTYIHSYLNIPDTSGRDSLFQAESRRCKTILNTIEKQTDGKHFCIFDELFSGTNPQEATKSAYAFLQYLRHYTHVDLFLTTHYVEICDKWENEENELQCRPIQNYKMIVEQDNGKQVFTYKLVKGISRIEGAIHILTDMEYPEEILNIVANSGETEEISV